VTAPGPCGDTFPVHHCVTTPLIGVTFSLAPKVTLSLSSPCHRPLSPMVTLSLSPLCHHPPS